MGPTARASRRFSRLGGRGEIARRVSPSPLRALPDLWKVRTRRIAFRVSSKRLSRPAICWLQAPYIGDIFLLTSSPAHDNQTSFLEELPRKSSIHIHRAADLPGDRQRWQFSSNSKIGFTSTRIGVLTASIAKSGIQPPRSIGSYVHFQAEQIELRGIFCLKPRAKIDALRAREMAPLARQACAEFVAILRRHPPS
jgi:hypothetical protein